MVTPLPATVRANEVPRSSYADLTTAKPTRLICLDEPAAEAESFDPQALRPTAAAATTVSTVAVRIERPRRWRRTFIPESSSVLPLLVSSVSIIPIGLVD